MDDLTKLFDTMPRMCRVCNLKLLPVKWDGNRWSVTCEVCKTYYEYEWLPKEQWIMKVSSEFKGLKNENNP